MQSSKASFRRKPHEAHEASLRAQVAEAKAAGLQNALEECRAELSRALTRRRAVRGKAARREPGGGSRGERRAARGGPAAAIIEANAKLDASPLERDEAIASLRSAYREASTKLQERTAAIVQRAVRLRMVAEERARMRALARARRARTGAHRSDDSNVGKQSVVDVSRPPPWPGVRRRVRERARLRGDLASRSGDRPGRGHLAPAARAARGRPVPRGLLLTVSALQKGVSAHGGPSGGARASGEGPPHVNNIIAVYIKRARRPQAGRGARGRRASGDARRQARRGHAGPREARARRRRPALGGGIAAKSHGERSLNAGSRPAPPATCAAHAPLSRIAV